MKDLLITVAVAIETSDVPGIPTLNGDQILQNGLNIAYFVAGIIAVIMIIVGGLTYSASAGDSAAVNKAKNMILYSVVGLVVIMLAFGVTNFVIGRFG